MPQAATLVLKNAAAVAVNYHPTKIRGGETAEYIDRTQSVIALQSRFTLSYRQSATTRQLTGKLTFPAADSQGAVNTCIAEFKIVTPLVMTGSDRSEILARIRAAIADAVITSGVVDGDTPY